MDRLLTLESVHSLVKFAPFFLIGFLTDLSATDGVLYVRL